MPPVPRGRTAGTVESAQVTPEEAAKIRASVASKEQAPSSRQQTAIFDNWREAGEQLGSPFEVERIPLSKLRAMRRDPMLGFGLSFIKTPHVRAKWYIDAKDSKGPNAQIAAHLDADLREIYPSYVNQHLNSLDFGYQAIAKRFQEKIPSATYVEVSDTGEMTEKAAWSEGSIAAIGWKPFIALPPEGVAPLWEKDEFGGIDYTTENEYVPTNVGASSGGDAKKFKIDLHHSLWVTNDRDQNFGSLYGYPRLGYAYRYWWSYWFRWAIADRAFERKADPSVKVLYPEGSFVDENTGVEISHAEYALMMGERMRSGGVFAFPSEPYEDANGRGTIRQWDIEFTKDATNFEPFDASFEYLDVQKLRSIWIPEQAFLEGKGGTSSRNVAAEMGESFVESQAVLSQQITDHLNRWVIPQWLAVNYPEFIEAGGSAKVVMQGFAEKDKEFTQQVLQLIGQQPSGQQELIKMVDFKKTLEDAGMPIASVAEQNRRQAKIEEEAAAAAAPTVAPDPAAGTVGVVPTAAGFSAYMNPREWVSLSDSSDFLDRLPDSPHYQDKAVKGFARQLWNMYRDLYRDEYETAAQAVERGEFDEQPQVNMALSDAVARASELLSGWTRSAKWPLVLSRTAEIWQNMAKRTSRVETQKLNLSTQAEEERIQEWIDENAPRFAEQIADTTTKELRNFIAVQLEEGVVTGAELAGKIREHFADFPDWKADRAARTITRDVYNAATLMAAEANGVERVQALDAQFGETDEDCEDRDGRIYPVSDAWGLDEHPNGTLGFRMVPAELSISYGVPGMEEGARYDEGTMTLFLSDELGEADQRGVLKRVVDAVA